jgi:hypothetical protein
VDGARRGVELRGLDGALLRRLAGYRLDGGAVAVPGTVVLRDRRGRRWVVGASGGLRSAAAGIPLRAGATLSTGRVWSVRRDGRVLWRARSRAGLPAVSQDSDVVSLRGRALEVRSGRFVTLPQDCAAADRRAQRWILLCGGRSYAPQRIEEWSGVARRVIAHRPLCCVGHWVGALLSRDGTRLLAQWSAECEVPVAFLGPVRGGRLRAIAGGGKDVPTSIALGWTPDGRAVVYLPEGACGGGAAAAGVYLVGAGGERRLVARAAGLRTRVGFWGA